ncbi:MAG: signal peptide peptidase SppA [Sphingobacteriia bacterium]|nr:signal peptide peptidase SppA [Sphingobacteriia bacterium]
MQFINNDLLIERKKLKRNLLIWRIFTILLLFIVLSKTSNILLKNKANFQSDHIARIKIAEILRYDLEKVKKLTILKNNSHVKALIIHINSPGGTLVGSEAIYKALRKIGEKVPIVAVMGDIATSGGYLVALGSDKIFTYEGTITGSIGVIFESFEVTEMLSKLGITPRAIKSSKFKATPSPFEKLEPEIEAELKNSLMTSFDVFKDIVKKRRNFNDAQLAQVANGKIFIGRDAIKLGLTDAIGGEEEALEWLKNEKKLDLEVKDYSIEADKNELELLLDSFTNKITSYVREVFSFKIKS